MRVLIGDEARGSRGPRDCHRQLSNLFLGADATTLPRSPHDQDFSDGSPHSPHLMHETVAVVPGILAARLYVHGQKPAQNGMLGTEACSRALAKLKRKQLWPPDLCRRSFVNSAKTAANHLRQVLASKDQAMHTWLRGVVHEVRAGCLLYAEPHKLEQERLLSSTCVTRIY